VYLAVGLIPVTIGLAGPSLAPGLEEPEQLIAILAEQHLSTFLYILFAGALISAILSTVDSCLLAAASLTSHNLVVPLMPQLSERGKVRCARIGVVVFGVAAYVIALFAEGVYELVATASAFGSAGIFVVGMFGLFSRVGGPASAHAALVAGMAVWAAGALLEWPTPYIVALAAAVGAYLLGAAGKRTATA
jgi:Na+/proline symporter